jgi:uncharacterized protein YggE
MAVRAEKEKATALATELGQKVGKPISVSESSYNMPMYKGNRMMQNVTYSDESAGSSGEVIALGQIEIKANVSVTFELE